MMLITQAVNGTLFLLGVLFRVLLYSYRVVKDPQRVVSRALVKSTFSKLYFLLHLYSTTFITTIGLWTCLYFNDWLSFFILDGFVWVSSLLLIVFGLNGTKDTYGSSVNTFTLLRNAIEIVVHAVIGYLTYYGAIDVQFWLGFIVFGLWPNRLIDTFPKFYIFRRHGTFNLLHLVITYATTILLYFARSSKALSVFVDILTVLYILMLVFYIYYYQWNTDGWRDLGILKVIYRPRERDHLQLTNIHKMPRNLDPALLKVYDTEEKQYKKWGINSEKFRTITGYGSNKENPLNGAVGQYIGRNITLENIKDDVMFKLTEQEMYEINSVQTPNPLDITKELFTRDETYYAKREVELTKQAKNDGLQFPNAIFSYWTQFAVDDWLRIRTSSDKPDDLNPLKTDGNIYVSKVGERDGQTFIISDEAREPLIEDGIKYVYNEKTHWWSTGIIYGCTIDKYKKIRDPPSETNGYKKGHIRVNENYLPLDTTGKELTGITVNLSSARGAIHYTFAKFHNVIADEISAKYPDMDDEHVRQTVKLIVSASIAKIHTIEWTPTLLNESFSDYTMYTFMDGLLGDSLMKLLTGGKRFWGKPRFENNLFTGIFGGTHVKKNNFAHTHEFHTVYKLHQLIPSFIRIKTSDPNKPIVLNIEDQSFAKSSDIFYKAGVRMHDFIEGMGNTLTATLEVFNTPEFLTKIASLPKTTPSVNGENQNDQHDQHGHGCTHDTQNPDQKSDKNSDTYYTDIFANMVWRDRDRGVYRYNNFRRGLGLTTFDNVDDFLDDCKKYGNVYIIDYETQIRAALKKLYNNDMEKIDVLVGCALEKKHPGFQIPDTIYYIFTFQTQRRLEEDIWFTEKMTPEYYTKHGIQIVENITLAKVLKKVYPELSNKFADDDNAFMYWGGAKKKVQRPSFLDAFYPES